MTEKKEKILSHALQLFAENGFNATSTSKIAKLAGVSEGLIFRHFSNKEGLLLAIMELGNEKAADLFSVIHASDDPKSQLKAVLSIPFEIEPTEYAFWKLMYSLKWQAKEYDASMSSELKKVITNIFKKLNYKNSEEEAELLLMLFDGIASSILLKKVENSEKLKNMILKKYQLL